MNELDQGLSAFFRKYNTQKHQGLRPLHSTFMKRKTKRAPGYFVVLLSFLGLSLLFFGWDIKSIPVLLAGIAMVAWELWYLFGFKNES